MSGGIAVIGLSHQTAPVEVRERFTYSDEEARAALRELLSAPHVDEAVLLSTCNRTELYVHGAVPATIEAAQGLLARRVAPDGDGLGDWVYHRDEQDAVRHLFRVVSSLESQVLGEAQIQGQVKVAYECARGAEGATGPVLSRLFEQALHVGGRVRSTTALGTGAASVPSAAVQLAKKIFGSLEGRRALLLGAGDMSQLALECLLAEGARGIVVANRTAARAQDMVARSGGTVVAFHDLAQALREADIVATATAAPHPVLTAKLMREAFPKGAPAPICIVDMALPRDVEPEVGEIGNVFLYDLDDLGQIVDDNLARRRNELPQAEGLIEAAVAEYWRWYTGRRAGPVIRRLRERAERQRRAELERMYARLPQLGDAERSALDELTRQMMNRMLHAPTVRLREAAANGHGSELVHTAHFLFALDESDEADHNPETTEGEA